MSTIAFFSKYLPSDKPSGVSVQVHRLAQQLVRNGHAVTCYSFSPAPEDAIYNVVQLEWKTGSPLLRKLFPAIAFRSVSLKSFDINHYHGDDYLCKGSSRRVRTFYGSALNEALHAATVPRFMYQALFYFFEWVSCLKKGKLAGISRTTAKRLPCVRSVIYCSVPLEIYTPGETSNTPNPSLLFLGDLDSRKRGRLLVNIFHGEIIKRFPDCTLTIIGPQPCNGKNIEYIGNCTEQELIRQYQKSWGCCMPSSYEGFGVPVLEAFACGCAVVATVNSGVREVITHEVNGMVCTPETLGITVIEVLENSKLRSSLIHNGKQSARSFATEKIAGEYERFYRELMQGLPE
jgi:glycosyltransferase involved in cell wall biosynthesis